MAVLLVTTGATVTFRALVSQVLTSNFVQKAQNAGFSKIVLQYGNEIHGEKHQSRQFFDKCLRGSNLVSSLKLKEKSNNKNGSVSFSAPDFELVCFPFTPNITDYITQADVVISHAGTGSIIDTLHRNKKLVVVVNEQLMDNHQREIAREFAASNYCMRFECDKLGTDSFGTTLQKLLNDEIRFDRFPVSDGAVLETILMEELSAA
ncbi:uncharacterized protein LODBEIA_P30430 [Lodderomyces beijingensis]|uniref:UDP-N-acetylglucosamine transferase subunit ALG13 n=1 Tax=Lodderomyces beijingensis TaxID=1775926 RepID=A0ABP0ZKZ8_9ASCO